MKANGFRHYELLRFGKSTLSRSHLILLAIILALIALAVFFALGS